MHDFVMTYRYRLMTKPPHILAARYGPANCDLTHTRCALLYPAPPYSSIHKLVPQGSPASGSRDPGQCMQGKSTHPLSRQARIPLSQLSPTHISRLPLCPPIPSIPPPSSSPPSWNEQVRAPRNTRIAKQSLVCSRLGFRLELASSCLCFLDSLLSAGLCRIQRWDLELREEKEKKAFSTNIWWREILSLKVLQDSFDLAE
ncbi:hypothetical protein CC78DRAFT_336220 [Lojkania enalia]|uniref:Uncharacterized protein n=1 Tax=Lojkania enalia TaxID=147567 RepID=A0A9P4N9F3_9PLEO|nr:hypothetical protein CC78DRAFT_336220 [Didymosphaeria enalia]